MAHVLFTLHYIYLFVSIVVQHILCCVFVLMVFVLCTLCCQFFLDCPFLIAPSVFSNVYLDILVFGQTSWDWIMPNTTLRPEGLSTSIWHLYICCACKTYRHSGWHPDEFYSVHCIYVSKCLRTISVYVYTV